MGANSDMRNKAGGSTGTNKLPAPYILPTGEEPWPSGIANEQIGGTHIYDSIDDCVTTLKGGKMTKDMIVIIRQHVSGGKTIKRARYYLETVPSITDEQTISDVPGYDFSNYFTLDKEAISDVEGSVEVRYAADYLGARPLFDIGSTWYNNGEASATDSTVIWSSTFDASKSHVWQSQRKGPGSDWGIPSKVFGEGYETDGYIDSRFKWVLKTDPVPNLPPQIINGEINNEPTGWDNVPDNFPDTDYNTSILTYDLYRIDGAKDVYGDLIGNWIGPLKISNDPNLVRYGATGNNTDFLNDTYWRAYYTPNLDKFMASREEVSPGVYTEWVVSQIDDENGEYPDYVFKLFDLGYTVTDSDKPTLKNPYNLAAPNDWSDRPPNPVANKVMYMSKSRKTRQGELIGQWSTPIRWDGLDTIRAVIYSDAGTVFKYEGGIATPTPAGINLTVKLFRGITEITSGITFKWYKGDISAPNELTEVTNTLAIAPSDVDSIQVYNAQITFEGSTYSDDITVLDVTDATDLIAYIKGTQGFVFKSQVGTKDFTPEFYVNGVLQTTGTTYAWYLDDVLQTESGSGSGSQNVDPITKVVTITGTDVTSTAKLKLVVTYSGSNYERTETIVDLDDGVSPIIQYSTDPITTPVASVSNWTSDATGANWMRVSTDGGSTYTPAILIKGESGTKQAGFTLHIYKNIEDGVDPVPTAPAVPGSGSIIPSGWTDGPTAYTGSQDVTYMTSCNFVLVADGDTSVLTRTNWTPLTSSYGTPIKVSGKDGAAVGVPGADGAQGEKGWSPVFALVPDGDRQILELVDWVGGAGTKPSYGGLYVGTTGLVSVKASAVKINGDDGAPGVIPGGAAEKYLIKSTFSGTIPNTSGLVTFDPGAKISGLSGKKVTIRITYATSSGRAYVQPKNDATTEGRRASYPDDQSLQSITGVAEYYYENYNNLEQFYLKPVSGLLDTVLVANSCMCEVTVWNSVYNA